MTTDARLTLSGRYYRHYPPEAPLGYAAEDIELAVNETVFLLIDVYGLQYDDDYPATAELPAFYRPSSGDKKGEIIRDRILPAKAAAKRAGLRVAYVTNYLSPALSEGTEWRNMSIRTCGTDVLESWRPPAPILEHMPAVAPDADEPLIRKQYYSGFFETHLDSLLRGWNIRNIVAVGFDSRICLATTVIDAMYRNYRVTVLRDATSTWEYPDTEEGGWNNALAIRFIEANVGYTVTTDEFIAACDELRAVSDEPARLLSAAGSANGR